MFALTALVYLYLFYKLFNICVALPYLYPYGLVIQCLFHAHNEQFDCESHI